MPYVCLGLGSNIEPAANLAEGIGRLLDEFGRVVVGDVVVTSPVDMPSRRMFLNTVAWIEAQRDADTLKRWLNDVEERMGRDRSAADRSTADRPIDFDILWYGEEPAPPAALPDEAAYLMMPYHRLRTFLLDEPVAPDPSFRRVELVVQGRRVGMEPTAIDADRDAGDVVR